VTETIFTFRLPYFKATTPKAKFSVKKYVKFGYLKENLGILFKDKNLWLCAFGLSMFWALSQLIIAVFPAHYKFMSGDDNVILIQLILAVSAIGLVSGSFFAGFCSKKRIELGLIPLGAFGIFISLLFFLNASVLPAMFILSMFFGFAGGVYIVPLNANIQLYADDENMGRTLAASNFIQNIFMIVFLLVAIFLSSLSVSTSIIFLTAALSSLIVGIIAFFVIRNLAIRLLLVPIFRAVYKVKSTGLENIPEQGSALLLGNHISWIDWMFVQIVVGRPIRFVMHVKFYKRFGIQKALKFFGVIPIGGSSSKSALEEINKVLKNGHLVCIFPEGHMTKNAKMDDFQKGFEVGIKGTDAFIIPFHIEGFWGSFWSQADKEYKKRTKKQRFRRVLTIAFGEKLPSNTTALEVRKAVIKASYSSWKLYLDEQKPAHLNFLDSVKKSPFKVGLVDFDSKEIKNYKLLTAVILFSQKLHLKGENIGLLLPRSFACSVSNLAVMSQGKRAVNLNYTMGESVLEKCIDIAGIEVIFSSKKFIEKLEKKGMKFSDEIRTKIFYLENLKDLISKKDTLKYLLNALLMPKFLIKKIYFRNVNLEDDAFILFSSGSEGEPKGVVLTHKNVLANIKQIAELLNSPKNEVMFASLPVFHSFGLTVTTIYPLAEGIKSICVADPTDAYMVGKMVFKFKATVMFGTSTFFRLYVRQKRLQPMMLASLRYCIAGGEKLSRDVKRDFRLKFGINLLEGYGTTETGPVISVNLPNIIDEDTFKERVFDREGSVGTPLGGTIVKIVDSEFRELGFNEQGLILIGAHQVMRGYYKLDLEWGVEFDGMNFYKTGDIGYIDEKNFVFITDRLSRFAKIGGEMVSLGAVEEEIRVSLNEDECVTAVNLEDVKKGEKIVLVYEGSRVENEIFNLISSSNLAPIARPSEVLKVGQIPLLGTGKVDLKAVRSLAKEQLS
ncbi:MAG: MFS transporter, partial [Campylobacter sp.]|nr:MFS transporter [Campylobacter sp.]